MRLRGVRRWAALVVVAAATKGGAGLFTVHDLGGLGGTFSRPHAINDHGSVVGEAETSEGALRAFLARRGEGMVDLGTLGGGLSRGYDVNADQVVVGEAEREDGLIVAFVWTAEEGMRELAVPEPVLSSRAVAINDRGVILGEVEDAEGVAPVLWGTGVVRRLSRLPVEGAVQAFDVNDVGDVVGQVETGPMEFFMSHAFVHRRAVTTPNLQSFRLITQSGSGAAFAVNDAGQAVGFAKNGDGLSRAYRYSQEEGLVFVDTLNGMYSTGLGINDQGWCVGEFIKSYAEDEHGFVHDGGWMHDLNDLISAAEGLHVLRGVGINEGGLIAAQAVRGERVFAVVLEPVALDQIVARPRLGLAVTPGEDRTAHMVVTVEGDVAVQRVSLIANREVLATAWEAPFAWNYTLADGERLDVYAVAYDGEGKRYRSARRTLGPYPEGFPTLGNPEADDFQGLETGVE